MVSLQFTFLGHNMPPRQNMSCPPHNMSYGLPAVHVSWFEIPWSYVPESISTSFAPVSQRKKRSRPGGLDESPGEPVLLGQASSDPTRWQCDRTHGCERHKAQKAGIEAVRIQASSLILTMSAIPTRSVDPGAPACLGPSPLAAVARTCLRGSLCPAACGL